MEHGTWNYDLKFIQMFTSRTVMVVGAGRGPLVRALLNAAEKVERKVKVYAVEKNPNAIVTYVVKFYAINEPSI